MKDVFGITAEILKVHKQELYWNIHVTAIVSGLCVTLLQLYIPARNLITLRNISILILCAGFFVM